MTTLPGPALESFPVVVFRFCSGRLELLNRDIEQHPGLAAAQWGGIVQGGWRKLVPEEFHPEVAKLAGPPESESYTTAEFPIYWMGNTVWLRVLAAAVSDEAGEKRVIGLAQDVSPLRQPASASDELKVNDAGQTADPPRRELCHDLSGPLTSIIVNCELLLESDCTGSVRHRLEAILSEAFRMDQVLRNHPGS